MASVEFSAQPGGTHHGRGPNPGGLAGPALHQGAVKGVDIMGLLFAAMLMGIPLVFALFDLSQTKA